MAIVIENDSLETKLTDLLTSDIGPAALNEENLKSVIKTSFIPWLKKKAEASQMSPREEGNNMATVFVEQNNNHLVDTNIDSAVSLVSLKDEPCAVPAEMDNELVVTEMKPIIKEGKPSRKRKKTKSGKKRSKSTGRPLHPRARAFMRRLSAMSAQSSNSVDSDDQPKNVQLFQCQKITATPKPPPIRPAFMKRPLANLVSSQGNLRPIQRKSLPNGLGSSTDLSKRAEIARVYGSNSLGDIQTKLIKVYLSEKQSGTLNVNGITNPCAPPATPLPDILQRYEYVPSMADFKSISLAQIDHVAGSQFAVLPSFSVTGELL